MRPDAIVFSGFPGAVQKFMFEEWYKRQKFAALSGLSAEASAELVQGHVEAVLHAIGWRRLKQLMEDIDVAAVIIASCKAHPSLAECRSIAVRRKDPVNLYYSFALDFEYLCVAWVGDFEAVTLVIVKSSLKYHPWTLRVLSQEKFEDSGPGAISAKRG